MRHFLTLFLLGFCLFAPAAVGQTTQPEIAARLMGKPLFLRGRWEDSKLKFLHDGTPKETYKTRSFTVSGFDTRSVTLKDGRLQIDGKRAGLEFNVHGAVKRLALSDVRVEIESGSGADFSKTLDMIFAPDLESMKPELPFYWKDIAAKNFVPDLRKKGDDAKSEPRVEGQPLYVGGNVLAPKILKTSEAVFSPEAREKHYSGDVFVRLIVDTDGSVEASSLKIMRAAGLGLDEQALAAALLYKFSPATRDGVPVKVVINLDVNFRIF